MCTMDDILLARMRDRLVRLRRVIEVAHNPEMIDILGKVAADIEADIRRGEEENGVTPADAEPVTIHLELPPEG